MLIIKYSYFLSPIPTVVPYSRKKKHQKYFQLFFLPGNYPHEVFKVMKGKDLQPRLLYPAKLSFRVKGQIKCFPDKVKLKEFIITKPLSYEMLKGTV